MYSTRGLSPLLALVAASAVVSRVLRLVSRSPVIMSESSKTTRRPIGRGAPVAPPNRFESTALEDDFSDLSEEDLFELHPAKVPTTFLPDASRSILCSNDSPDIPFRFSINPYRGCEHGCAYCYARPGHEYLGMNAGLDFESKVLVKHDAAELLRDELGKASWKCEPIAISGVTDCYQPAERHFKITRSLLEVMLEANQPCGIVTKNALVLRDLDLLVPMAERNLIRVFLSVTTLDQELAQSLEPRTSTPAARLAAIEQLHAAGVPVGAMMAPIIPGLNDEEIPAVLTAVAKAGALTAAYVLLRLPLAVEPIFREWLAVNVPLKRDRVEGLIRSTRGGNLSENRFGHRMRGGGQYAEQIATTFKVFRQKLGLDQPLPPQVTDRFRPPRSSSGQQMLF